MQLQDILGITLFVFLYGIAFVRLFQAPCSWGLMGTRLLMSIPILAAIVLLSAGIGFAIGGRVGMIGNALGAAIWMSWLLIILATRRPPSQNGNQQP